MSDEMNTAIPSEFDEEDLEIAEEVAGVVDPTQVITLRTSGGESRYIPTNEPLSLSEVKSLSGLTFGAVQFYMNAQVIADDTIVPVGAVVAAVGNVKGGFLPK